MARTRITDWFLFTVFLENVSGFHLPNGVQVPSLPPGFEVSAKCKAWRDPEPTSYRIAYTRDGEGVGNRLKVSYSLRGVIYSNLFDFYNNILVKYNETSKSGILIKGIPESVKYNLCFPVKYKTEGERKTFYKPESLFYFDAEEKRPAEDTPTATNEWTVNVVVPTQEKTLLCTTHVSYSRKSDESPYCEEDFPVRDVCPLVPRMATVLCEEDKIIVYSFEGFVSKYNRALFEYDQRLMVESFSTMAPETEVPVKASNSVSFDKGDFAGNGHDSVQGMDPGLVAVLFVLMLVLGICIPRIGMVVRSFCFQAKPRPQLIKDAAAVGAGPLSMSTAAKNTQRTIDDYIPDTLKTTKNSPIPKGSTYSFSKFKSILSEKKGRGPQGPDKIASADTHEEKSISVMMSRLTEAEKLDGVCGDAKHELKSAHDEYQQLQQPPSTHNEKTIDSSIPLLTVG